MWENLVEERRTFIYFPLRKWAAVGLDFALRLFTMNPTHTFCHAV